MAEFIRAQIFGTTFEITSRYEAISDDFFFALSLSLTALQVYRPATGGNGGFWTRLVWLTPLRFPLRRCEQAGHVS